MAARYDTAVPGLNRLLRDLRALPKEAQADLRTASQDIATRYMVPAWQAAARGYAGPWGERIAGSVRARRDRVPLVVIGGNRRSLTGGASPTMVRFPAHAGPTGRGGRQSKFPAAFTQTDWIDKVKPAYIGPALREWGDAISGVCRDFNNGPVM